LIITGTLPHMDEAYIPVLADGQLPLAKTTLYLCPLGKKVRIELITFVNITLVNRTINLYLKRDGVNSRRIIPINLTLAAGGGTAYFNNIFSLESGDLIEGDASAAGVIDYTISGYERD